MVSSCEGSGGLWGACSARAGFRVCYLRMAAGARAAAGAGGQCALECGQGYLAHAPARLAQDPQGCDQPCGGMRARSANPEPAVLAQDRALQNTLHAVYAFSLKLNAGADSVAAVASMLDEFRQHFANDGATIPVSGSPARQDASSTAQ